MIQVHGCLLPRLSPCFSQYRHKPQLKFVPPAHLKLGKGVKVFELYSPLFSRPFDKVFF